MRLVHVFTSVLISIGVTVVPLAAQNPAPLPWDTILRAHHVPWASIPVSVQMSGVSTRGRLTEAVKITATGQEQIMIELGSRKEVSTPTRVFKDDGERLDRKTTPAGFAQLDLTGIFFVAQLRTRSIQTEVPVLTTFHSARAWRIHGRGTRTEIHYRQLPVHDEFDIYVDDAGLLLGIARTFYKEAPLFTFTMELAFTDYRITKGALLPYRIERTINGHNVETLLIDGYDFDVATPAAMFEPRRSAR
jgi:hypothetical protein